MGNTNPALTPPRLMSNSPSLQKKTESVFFKLHYPDHVTHRTKHMRSLMVAWHALKKCNYRRMIIVSLRHGRTSSHQEMMKAQETNEDEDPAERR